MSGVTTRETLRRGEQIGQGAEGAYYRLAPGPGEAHTRRLELAPGAPISEPGRRTSLLHFAHITDLHILDPASPGRFEFVDRLAGPPALHLLLPAYRPHEFLQPHALAATLAAIGAVAGSPLTGAPVSFLLATGDYVDNAQVNELRWAMALLAGGEVRPFDGRPYEGVAAPDWGDPAYWRPDGAPDEYKRRWGFPTYPGLLDQAAQPFQAPGVGLPWLSCRGNHDALIQGTVRSNSAVERLLTGPAKARALPDGFDLLGHLERYLDHPQALLTGPATTVTPDLERRTFSAQQFIQAHYRAGGEPQGHGFSAHDLGEGSAYYIDDRYPPLRLIALDTVNPAGHYQGSVGAAQLAWLEQRLIEVHARYWDTQGWRVDIGHTDRLVLILSHHGVASLTNDRTVSDVESDVPRALGPEVEALLHRFPNVILWVNGHTHRNRVLARPDPAGRSTGFWEVTTASLIGWPCQARLIEVIANDDGTLSVLCTMLDHAAPADPLEADGVTRLAAIHRELAANDPRAGLASGLAGAPADRNVELVLPAPFPIA